MNIFSKIQKMEKLSLGLRSLYMGKIIRDIGVSIIGMFGPIFVYTLSGSLKFALIFYGALNLFYILAMPLWAKIMKYKSLHFFMIIGNLLLIVYFLIFYFLAQANEIIWPLIVSLIFFGTTFRVFFWIPYHVDFARFINKHHRGRQISFLAIIVSLIGILLPIFSAFIISKFGFSVLYILAGVVLFISIFPLFFVPHTREKYSFGYFETFKQFFDGQHIKTNLAYIADGFQNYIGCLIWPIFIFILLDGKYMQVGLISAAVVLVSCVIRYIVGEATDKFDKKKLMRTGSILYSLGWIFKAIIESGLHIFLVGIYHNFTGILMRTPFDALMYEIAADEGHYVDEFTIMRETALTWGRIIMVILALILLALNINIVWIFILGAVVSVFINLISKEEFYLANR